VYQSYTKIEVDTISENAIVVADVTEMEASMSAKESRLTAAWLRENMHYEPSTGEFWWTKPGFGRTVGKRVGSRLWSKGKSYIAMKINGDVYYAHRVAWLYHYGEWPARFVDHIDDDRSNNAIENLRLATSAENAARRHTKRSIAPSRGVFPHGPGYVARIHFKGKRHYLGYFKTAEEAQAVYESRAKEIHGDFAYPLEDRKTKRGDYLNVPKCEMCGCDGAWGSGDIRRDTTSHGKIRGTLCLQCWNFVSTCNHDKRHLQQMYRAASDYLDALDVFDEDSPKFRSDVPYVSLFTVADQTDSDGKLVPKLPEPE
jgi:hypothetical protein